MGTRSKYFCLQNYLLQIMIITSSISAFQIKKPLTSYLFNSIANSKSLNNAILQTSKVPKLLKQLYPTIIEKSRTIPNVCASGTLCSTSNSNGIEGSPFGSAVDYITDEKGWPIFLLNELSEHSNNIKSNSRVSLFCQLPTSQYYGEVPAGLGQVTIVGDIVPPTKREEVTFKYAFPLVHPHTEPLIHSSKHSFRKIRPVKIHYTGGYGVMSSWINITEYEHSKPDALATDIPRILPRINLEKETELKLVCKHFLQIDQPIETVHIQTIDRFGFDLRVKTGSGSGGGSGGGQQETQKYRIAFRHRVVTSEDAKSELLKLFQECWQREYTGKYYKDLPNILKYSQDQEWGEVDI